MAKSDDVAELESRILYLETKVKHLTNEFRLTRAENETATDNYFEILGFGSMEKVFTIMRRFVQTLSRYYGYAFTDN